MFRKIVLILICLWTAICLVACNSFQDLESDRSNSKFIEAEVLDVVSSVTVVEEEFKAKRNNTRIRVRVLSGPQKGKELEINQEILPEDVATIDLPHPKDQVVLSNVVQPDGTFEIAIVDYKRLDFTLSALIIALIALLIIGGGYTLTFLIIISLTLIAAVFALIPLLQRGWNIVFIVLVFASFVSFFYNLFHRESSNKFKINVVANFFSFLIVGIITNALVQTGHFRSALAKLSFLERGYAISTDRNLVTAMIMLTLIGAVISISINAVNSAYELVKKFPTLSILKLTFTTVKHLRKNIMTNYLIIFFIYFGLLLPTTIPRIQIVTFNLILNNDIFALCLTCFALSGLGLVISSFCSSYITCLLLKPSKTQSQKKRKSTTPLDAQK